jgi:lipase chaperone LimK
MRQLSRFAISVRADDFVLHLQDEAGEKMDFVATPDQLDAVIDALDEMLSENEEAYFGIEEAARRAN